ncbi:MAG: methyltransferase domain-containing protein [Pseudorhodoplanes sp.]
MTTATALISRALPSSKSSSPSPPDRHHTRWNFCRVKAIFRIEYKISAIAGVLEMDRIARLRKYASKESDGIEIGPGHWPIVPKREGFRSLSLDVFDYPTLIAKAVADPNLTREQVGCIEPVDLLGPAQNIASLVREKFGERKFDYVVSSHNFEHVPDPIRFLQGCREILRDGGHVSMAIPDLRCCHDFFRSVSLPADLLEAHFDQRTMPTNKQVFLWSGMRAEHRSPRGGIFGSFDIEAEVKDIFPEPGGLTKAYAAWQERETRVNRDYQDAHCWAFTPASFQWIALELQHLSLFPFVLESVEGPTGNEFHVHLRAEDPIVEDFETRRGELMRATGLERTGSGIREVIS